MNKIKLGKLFVTAGMLGYYATSGLFSLANMGLESDPVKKLRDELDNASDSKGAYMMMLRNDIDKMDISSNERVELIARISPLINKYFDKMSDEELANIIYAIRKTEIKRNVALEDANGRFCHNTEHDMLDGNGVIELVSNNEAGTLVHECTHAMQSWQDDDTVYRDACASLVANHGYDSLQALFMMLGDLGDKDVLCTNLLKGNGDSYFDYLRDCYPSYNNAIERLQGMTKEWFTTYKKHDYENSLRLQKDIMEIIEILYNQKYDGKISDDYVFEYFVSEFLKNAQQWEIIPCYNYFTSDDYWLIDSLDSKMNVFNDSNRFKVRGRRK